jgi:hypothetical protein
VFPSFATMRDASLCAVMMKVTAGVAVSFFTGRLRTAESASNAHG